MSNVTVSSKGQVVIPRVLRKALRLREGTRLEIRVRSGELVMTPAKGKSGRRADWRSWRGSLAGTGALKGHLEDHRREAKR